MFKLKQIFCIHWFDLQPDREVLESHGAIVCNQQRIFRIKRQSRICSKCKLTEERDIDSICEGWE